MMNPAMRRAAMAAIAMQKKRRAAEAPIDRGDIVGEHLVTTGNTANQDNYLSDPHTLAANRLAIAILARTATTPNLPTALVDSRGLVWSQFATAQGTTLRVTGFYVVTGPVAPGLGTVQANHAAGQTPTGAVWSVSQFAGVDLDDPFILANLVQTSQAANTAAAIALPNPLEHEKNAMLYALMHAVNESVAVQAGGGFTKLGEAGYASPATHLMSAYKVGDTADTPTWATSAGARFFGIELKAA